MICKGKQFSTIGIPFKNGIFSAKLKKLTLAVLLLCSAWIPTFPSHIVGGEIELMYVRGNLYQVFLKMYVDNLNATPGVIASETEAYIGIFEKFTHKKMAELKLPRKFVQQVDYGSTCSNDPNKKVQTSMLAFFENIQLDPAVYNSPNGYYISYGNCCRNGVIINIQNPFNEGMAFYSEFPPLVKNGNRFYNSSPHFNKLTGDFPCVGKPFTFDFSGVDYNGDSLAYRLTTPLAGFVDLGGFINPQSGPYDSIKWVTGYDRTHQIPGTPALQVNPVTGQLTLVASQTGLFVFSVTVDEFRDGEKIGEVKRDFQFLVTNCEDNAPPGILLEMPDGSAYNPQSDTISLSIDADTCFTVLVADSSTIKFGDSENLSVRIIENTLPPGVATISSNVFVSPDPGSDTASTNFCFNACNILHIKKDTVFTLSLMVTDAPKCPMSLARYDTLNVIVEYKPQVNFPPSIGLVGVTGPVRATVGKQIFFDVYGIDPDSVDIITLSTSGLPDNGMFFNQASGQDSISSRFYWTPDCEDPDKGMMRLRFIVDDNSCIPENRDTIFVDVFAEDTLTNLPNISPVNLFTPNGDDRNDYFHIPNIPEGNCEYFFKKVAIFNRWGAKVYESEDPNFRWYGEKQPSGIYYFRIDINEKEFKGWINLVR